MISPEAILKLAGTYYLAAFAGGLLVPKEYAKLTELVDEAWKHMKAGEKVRLAGRFHTEEGVSQRKLDRFVERAHHFVEAGKALRKLIQAYDRSPKEYYQPIFSQIIQIDRVMLDEFMKKARTGLRRNTLTMDDLKVIPMIVRQVQNAFLARQVIRPLEEIQDIIHEREWKPKAPSKPRKTKKQKQLAEKKKEVEEGKEVALRSGITLRRKRPKKEEAAPAEPEEPKPVPKPMSLEVSPEEQPEPEPEMLSEEERELAEMMEDVPGEDWMEEWEKMKAQMAGRSTS